MRIAGVLAALLLLAVAAWWLLQPEPPRAPAAESAPQAKTVARAPELPPPPGLPDPPASLRGTDVPGGFVVDASGTFRPTPDALELFDYYLSATGEESDAAIRARIEAAIDARLDGAANAAARDLLRRYLDYREGVRELVEQGLAGWSLERRFQHLRELRRGYFTPAELDALFAAEEERLQRDLEARRVARDPELDPEARARRLEAIEAARPERAQLAQAALRLREQEARMRAEGASDAEIRALREEIFGPEAAERLAELDRQRAAWNARMDEWRETLGRLEEEGADAEEIARARSERFSGPELRRAEALERLPDSPGPGVR